MEILLIEDDEAVREFIREVLLGAGYFVSVAGNGKDGLDEIRRDPDIGMVITDIVMPEKEGIETIIEIKQTWPQIKIIAISGGGRICAEDYLHIARELGADITLKKPFTRPELLGAVAELTRHKYPDVSKRPASHILKVSAVILFPVSKDAAGENRFQRQEWC